MLTVERTHRLAQTVCLRALLKPACGLKLMPARDAVVTPESAGSVSLSKCSVKDAARLLGANCPKPRLKSVAARLGSEHVLVVSSASLFFSSSLPLSVDFKLPVLPQSLPQQLTSGPRAQITDKVLSCSASLRLLRPSFSLGRLFVVVFGKAELHFYDEDLCLVPLTALPLPLSRKSLISCCKHSFVFTPSFPLSLFSQEQQAATPHSSSLERRRLSEGSTS